MKYIVLILIVAIVGAIGYDSYKDYSVKAATLAPQHAPRAAYTGGEEWTSQPEGREQAGPAFKCDGRTHCSHMTSCAEATYFLQHCPNTKMDGNNDGVPCEKQWCN